MARPIVRLIRERAQVHASCVTLALTLIAASWLANLFTPWVSPYGEAYEIIQLMRGLSAWGAVLLMLVTVAWWHGDASALSQRLPSWLMTRPIRTATLAGVEYGVRLALLWIVASAASAMASAAPVLDHPQPLPVGHVMVTAAILISAGWLFGGLGRWTATVCSAVCLFAAFFLWLRFTLPRAGSASVDPGLLPCAVAILGCGLPAALGVWLDRHGVWSEFRSLGLASAPAAVLPVTATPPAAARSAFAAQVRAEFREWAWILPAASGIMLCLGTASVCVMAVTAYAQRDFSTVYVTHGSPGEHLFSGLYLAAGGAGLLRLLHLYRTRGTTARTFFLTLPQSALDLGNARLAAGGLGIAAILVLNLVALLLAKLIFLPVTGWAPLFDLLDLDLLAQVALGIWALYWLAPLLVLTPPHLYLACLTVQRILRTIAPTWASSDGAMAWIFTGVYAAFLLMIVALSWNRVRPPRRQLCMTLGAAVVGLVVFLPHWTNTGRPAETAAIALIVATAPALPFLTVPATAHWLRHR